VAPNSRSAVGTKKLNLGRCCFVASAIGVIIIITFLSFDINDAVAQVKPSPAAKLADAWWYVGDGKSRSNESSQKTGVGPEDGTFFAYTGTLINLGSYKDAWNFYARKCGAKETFDEAGGRIIGQPSATQGYYTIFQRTDGGRKTTTFASHERDATVTVFLHEIESSPEKTLLQLSVVVTRR
jgi:hypothetical protein